MSEAISASDFVHLPADMWDAIVAHARQEYPRECCGIISGRDGRLEKLHSLRNIAEGNRFYEIDPAQLMHLEFEELEQAGTEIVAIYHSHPESQAYPSATDLDLAFWPEAVYLICTLENKAEPAIRGFRMREGVVTEVQLLQ
jgi:proteasome lid subunit RPN8/RPN11